MTTHSSPTPPPCPLAACRPCRFVAIALAAFVLGLALLSGGCGASSEAVRGPGGQTMVNVTCRRSISNCYEEAARACSPGAYRIVNQADESGLWTNPSTGQVLKANRFSMLVACQGAK